MSLKDYEITIHVTYNVNCEDKLYLHRKDQNTQFQTFVFRGSLKKCPKYYYFTKTQRQYGYFFSSNYRQESVIQLSKMKELIQIKNASSKLAVFKIQNQNNQIFITTIRSYHKDQTPLYHMVRLYEDGYKLQQGDIIKLGMNFLTITNIKNQNNKQRNNKNFLGKTLNAKVKLYNPNGEQQRECKFCFNTQSFQDTQNERHLINPCKCENPVHIKCLQNWIKKRCQVLPAQHQFNYQQNQFHPSSRVNILNNNKMSCELCKEPLPLRFQIQNMFYDLEKQDLYDFQIKKIEKDQPQAIIKIKQLNKGPIKMGRSQTNQITFYDQSVSRKHAWFQKDLQSDYDILLKDSYAQVPKFGTLVQVSKNNQKFLLSLQQRRGIQIQDFIIIFQLKKKKIKQEEL